VVLINRFCKTPSLICDFWAEEGSDSSQSGNVVKVCIALQYGKILDLPETATQISDKKEKAWATSPQ
jgi:hypothetical protein